jgi:hypothetical protein
MASRDELAALRPGAAVRVEGEDFVIERTTRFEEEGKNGWLEHRVSSDGSGRSLWLEIPYDPGDPMIVYESSATLDFTPDGRPEIEHGGERLPLLASSRATYRSVERSAAPKSGELVYHEYAKDGRYVTYECRSDGTIWEVSEGRELDPAAIEVLA